MIAHWSPQAHLSRSIGRLIGELQAHGFQIVLVSACESAEPLSWSEGADRGGLTVVRKPNVGYDFGSWSIGLEAVPEVCAAQRVLLMNDSMAGPFTSIGPLLAEFESTAADVWGLTDTYQFEHHLQSYCLGFAGGVLADRPLREFWAGIRHEQDKSRIIIRNEIGLSRLLTEEGYVQAAAFAHEHVVASGENPVIVGWRRLLERGFPFLKREILRTPGVAPGGHLAPRVLKHLFDVDVADWVEERAA